MDVLKFLFPLLLILVTGCAEGMPEGFEETLNTFVAEQGALCHELDEGKLTFNADEIDYSTDFNGDGMIDPIVDDYSFGCSTSASLFYGGTGGHNYAIFVSSENNSYEKFEHFARDYDVVNIANVPVLVLAIHGSSCGLSGYKNCFVAKSWNDEKFTSVQLSNEMN